MDDGVRIDNALRRQHHRAHGVEHVDPSKTVMTDVGINRINEGVDDGRSPEPCRQDNFNEVLRVT